MAVEASRIKGRFKELFPKANLSNKRLDEISARLAKKPADDAEDSAIDEVLNDANEIYPFDQMAKDEHRLLNAENQLKKRNSSGQSADDQDPPADPPQDPPAPDEKVPAWAQKMAETNNTLLEKIKALETGKITETRMANATKLFNENETLKGLKETVKAKWIARIDVNSETPVEDQITELESEYADLVQVTADNKRQAGAPPNGSVNTKPTDAELDAVAGGLV